MPMPTSIRRQDSERAISLGAMAALVAALLIPGVLGASRLAQAHGVAGASDAAVGGLTACSTNSGKALYNCVADVLDTMSNQIEIPQAPEAQRSLHTAATRLRAAVNKVQALSAITQCQAVIAGAIRQVVAAGTGNGKGLSKIAGVLAQAARLIQSKG